VRIAAVLIAAVLGLSSCSLVGDDGPDPELVAEPLESPSSTVAVDADLSRFYEQEVEWSECRESMECARIEVPLDYTDPGGKAIALHALRVPATHEEQRIGSLVVNPGGPGASGIDYAARAEVLFGDEVRAAFDIVGFDPRGVGSSTPVDCLSDREMDRFVAFDPDPDTPEEVRQGAELLADFGEGCRERSGDLAAHVSTAEAARDIDILRAALGQEQLAYFGASYGTYLGATYADQFPERVGRMVLDGAVDPTLGSVETGLVQAEGFEVALRAYVGHCVDEGDCYLGATVDEGVARVAAFLESLDANPISGDDSRELTQGLGVFGIFAPLYSRESWSALDAALAQALEGEGRLLLTFADVYFRRGPEGYLDNSYEALYAVNCLDPHDDVSPGEVRSLEDDFLEASPTFGRMFAFSLSSCTDWPVDGLVQQPVLDAPGAAPIMVVGTSRDPATPLAWAEAMAEQLTSGVLVRRDGDGHTGYRAGNECVDTAVEEYLVSGEVPDGTVDC
jgi:pimeloyl-ACP methyl ester carboxylesterase